MMNFIRKAFGLEHPMAKKMNDEIEALHQSFDIETEITIWVLEHGAPPEASSVLPDGRVIQDLAPAQVVGISIPLRALDGSLSLLEGEVSRTVWNLEVLPL